jgi:hypothetical protein
VIDEQHWGQLVLTNLSDPALVVLRDAVAATKPPVGDLEALASWTELWDAINAEGARRAAG